jgi:hypothetical protein
LFKTMISNKNPQAGAALIRNIVLALSVIIILTVVLLGFRAGRIQARDTQRLSDVRQIQSALKLFYDYNQKYPEAVGKQPKDIIGYMNYWPQAPTPTDGSCTDAQNQYVYDQLDRGESYVLSFCLGTNVEGNAAGFYQLKP